MSLIRNMNLIPKSLWVGIILILGLNGLQADQTISLSPGWNLVSIQVDPLDATPGDGGPSVADIFSSEGVKAVWAYRKGWLSYERGLGDSSVNHLLGSGLLAVDASGLLLHPVSVGQAFWVYVLNGEDNFTIAGTRPSVAPALELANGWNLIGIPVTGPPGVEIADEGKIRMLALMAKSGLDYTHIVKWEKELQGQSQGRFAVRATENVGGNEFDFFDANAGYWVHVSPGDQPDLFQPRLKALARGDINILPERFGGPEDVNISLKSAPVDSADQEVIRFFPGETVQALRFSNEGGGLLLWELSFSSEVAGGDWVSLSTDPTAKKGKTPQQQSGVTTVETEIVYLRLDRKHLESKEYEGSLKLTTSAGTIEYTVIADVAPLSGDWSGTAIVETVGTRGRHRSNAVPDVDLNLSFFEDIDASGNSILRGAIDSRKSVVWPIDVQLLGYWKNNTGNAFHLAGGYVLPPGDVNNPPFDEFDARLDDTGSNNDVDWDNDGVIDDQNPFPFPIYRSLSLDGELEYASPIKDEGFVVKGTYREVVYGMLRDPIILHGSFEMRRNSHIPFIDRVAESPSDGSPSPVAVYLASLPPDVNDSSEIEIDVTKKHAVFDVRLSFDVMTPNLRDQQQVVVNSDFVLKLKAPNGDHQIVLHDGSVVEPERFESINYPISSTALDETIDWTSFVRSIEDPRGTWILAVENRTQSPLRFRNVKLSIVGQPLMDVYGKVTDPDGKAINGADLSVLGLPSSYFFADYSGPRPAGPEEVKAGEFVLKDLPAMPLNLSAFLPGYGNGSQITAAMRVPEYPREGIDTVEETRLAARFMPLPVVPTRELGIDGFDKSGSDSENRLVIEMVREDDQIKGFVFPKFGMAPLTVEFDSFPSGTEMLWRLGVDQDNKDGVDSVSGASASYEYRLPGVYEVEMVYQDNVLMTSEVVVYPSPSSNPTVPNVWNLATDVPGVELDLSKGTPGPYTAFVFRSWFHGGGSIPRDFSDKEPVRIEITDESNFAFPAVSPSATLAMLQHTYAASFDIDLAPYVGSIPSSGPCLDDAGNPLPLYLCDQFAGPESPYATDPRNRNPSPLAGTNEVEIASEEELSAVDDPNVRERLTPVNDPGWMDEDHDYVLWPRKWYVDDNESGDFDVGDTDIPPLLGYDRADERLDSPENKDPDLGVPFQYYRMACTIGGGDLCSGSHR